MNNPQKRDIHLKNIQTRDTTRLWSWIILSILIVLFFAFVFALETPNLIINAPANDSNATTFPYAILNATVGNVTSVWIYASDNLTTLWQNLVYYNASAGNITITYNWSVPVPSPTNNTILLLHFDNNSVYGESQTGAYDYSLLGNNATLQSATFTSAQLGQGVDFDGVVSKRNVTVADANLLSPASYTIMAWIYMKGSGVAVSTGSGGVPSMYPLVMKGMAEAETSSQDVSYAFGINSTTLTLAADFENDSASSNFPVHGSTALSTNKWYHVALVVEATKYQTLFINGLIDKNQSNTGTPETISSMKVGIGAAVLNTTQINGAFNGTIDDVIILNRSLSPPEVAAYYNLTQGIKYWVVNASNSTNYVVSSGIYQFNLTSAPAVPDTTPPVVNLIAPTNGSSLTSAAQTFNATFSDDVNATIASFHIWNSTTLLNQTNQTINGVAASVNITFSLSADGIYFWNFRAYDASGNAAFNATNFTLTFNSTDATAPQVTITFPQNTTYIALPLDFNVSLNENGTVLYTLTNGVTNVSMSSLDNRNFNATNASLAEQQYTFIVYANDSAGNKNYTTQVTFIYNTTAFGDITPPNISFAAPTPSNGTTQVPAEVPINISSADANTHYVFVTFDSDGIFWTKMDERNTSAGVVDSLGRYNASIVGSPTINRSGIWGNATHLSGLDYINYGTGPTAKNGTFSIWVKFDNSGTEEYIASKVISGDGAGEWRLYKNATGNIVFRIEESGAGQGNLESATILSAGQWYNLVAVWNTSMELYINGVREANVTSANAGMDLSTVDLNLGRNNALGNGNMTGWVDDVVFLNRPISQQEVSALYNATANKYYRNFTTLSQATHNWTAYTADANGNKNSTSTLYITINSVGNAPNISVNSPAVNGTITATTAVLNVTVSDLDGGLINVTFYGRNVTGGAARNWTFIAIPDTQFYSESYPAIFTNQTVWIANQTTALNIQFVTGLGDIVQTTATTSEWDNANASYSVLDGNNSHWMINVGNHDKQSGSYTNFQKYFGVPRFNYRSWWGDNQTATNANHYMLFTIERDDFIMVSLEFCPTNTVVSWANDTLQLYPNRKAIIISHGFLNSTGARDVQSAEGGCGAQGTGNTEYIWNGLVYPRNNTFMVLSGHWTGQEAEKYRNDTNSGGTMVHQILSNYQSRANGGDGWLRIMTVDPLADKIYVQTYNVNNGSSETDSNSQFSFSLLFDLSPSSSFIQIGQVLNINNGTAVNISWTGLNNNASYEWYAIASDNLGQNTTSLSRNFSVQSSDTTPPVVNLIAPTNGSSLTSAAQTFNATFSDDVNATIASFHIWNSTTLLNQTNQTINGVAASVNITFSLSADGIYFWNFRAYDNSSNSAFNATNFTLTLDTTPPVVNLIAPANNSALRNATISFNVTATDARALTNITLHIWNSTTLINTTLSLMGATSSGVNITVVLPRDGTYFWNYFASDNASNRAFNTTNFTLLIDTTLPLVEFGDLTPVDGANLTRSNFVVNVTVTETNEANITFRLFNTSGIANTTTFTTQQHSINFSLLVNGTYQYNVTIVDIAGNQNTTQTRLLVINTTFNDTLAPNVTFSCTPSSVREGNTVTCTCTATDDYDASPTLNYSANPSTNRPGTFVVGCTATDDAANSGQANASYIVREDSSGSDASGGAETFRTTFTATQEQLEQGYPRSLNSRERIRFSFENDTHYVNIIQVNQDSVTLQVQSTPQTAILLPGQSKKFEITQDDYFDILVTLQAIRNSQANLTIKAIHEKISLPPSLPDTEPNTTISPEQPLLPTPITQQADRQKTKIWVFIGAAILLLGGGILYYRVRQKHRYPQP